MPSRSIASRRPRLLMTVATRVSSRSAPRSRNATASTPMIWSPSTSWPPASTARHRSASPSWAIPASAPAATTASLSGPRCVEPYPSLMLRPSGSAPITTTSAPASRSARGAAALAAPWAQSTTTFNPSSRFGREPSSRATYRSVASASGRTRPTPAPVGRSQSSPRRRSMSSSTSSGSLWPPLAKNLIPLSGIGLWDAERTTPRSAPVSATSAATPGVGRTPASPTSTPALARPAITAAARNSPQAPGSRPTTPRGRGRANGPGRSCHGAAHTGEGSALAVLRGLAGLLEAGLLALLHPRVAGEEAGLLQRGAVGVEVDPVEGAGHAEAQRAGLAGGAAAVDAGDDVEAALEVGHLERVVDQLLVDLVREVVLEGAAVDLPGAAAGDEAHPGDGLLAAAGRGAGGGDAGAAAAGLGRARAVAARGVLVEEVLDLGTGLGHCSPQGNDRCGRRPWPTGRPA